MSKLRVGCGDTGKNNKVEADCITAEDGSVTCNTNVVSPASNTKARHY